MRCVWGVDALLANGAVRLGECCLLSVSGFFSVSHLSVENAWGVDALLGDWWGVFG